VPGELTPEQKKEVERLKEIDRKVRQHEMAHVTAAAGVSVTGAQFQYQRGPDGQMYAVAGEVRIDTSEVPNDPEATAEKMQKVERAALAPQDPSPQDERVAAEARAREMKARLEMMMSRQGEQAGAETSAEAARQSGMRPLQLYRKNSQSIPSSAGLLFNLIA
jgi:hypothetical protein